MVQLMLNLVRKSGFINETQDYVDFPSKDDVEGTWNLLQRFGYIRWLNLYIE